jgi:hypothetical protein
MQRAYARQVEDFLDWCERPLRGDPVEIPEIESPEAQLARLRQPSLVERAVRKLRR